MGLDQLRGTVDAKLRGGGALAPAPPSGGGGGYGALSRGAGFAPGLADARATPATLELGGAGRWAGRPSLSAEARAPPYGTAAPYSPSCSACSAAASPTVRSTVREAPRCLSETPRRAGF